MNWTRTLRLLTLLNTLALVLSAVAAPAAAQLLPPGDEVSGLGENDVRDEPNHRRDANGFTRQGFTPQREALVLESYYVSSVLFLEVDANNALNAATKGDDYNDFEQQILPGLGAFHAYWGWWTDTGSGDWTQEAGLGGGPNGAIDDGWDNHAADASPEESLFRPWTFRESNGPWAGGPWDEFVWRGENPWAGQHGHDAHLDAMYMFLQPGSHNVLFNHWRIIISTRGDRLLTANMGILSSHADGPQEPDWQFTDNTDERSQDWMSSNGWNIPATDASLLMTTVATTSVNPGDAGGLQKYPHDADAVDVDVYTSVHPALERLYRQAVWDPGNEQASPLDGLVGGEGPKGAAKGVWSTMLPALQNAALDAARAPLDPVGRHMGLLDDSMGFHADAHEPNTPWDDYPGASCTAEPCGEYGALDVYYRPINLDHGGYAADERAFLDVQGTFGVPMWFLWWDGTHGADLHPVPNAREAPSEDHQNAAAPQALVLEGRFGTWWDADGDTWVGDLDEDGRHTSGESPYASGAVDDPNDYSDHAANTDPAKSAPYEWRGLCANNRLTATLEPLNTNGRWGAAGVYVVDSRGDDPGNPYDDMAADALGTGPWGVDGDGVQLSRYRTEGAITVPLKCDGGAPHEGVWRGDAVVVFPTGTAEYDVRVTAHGRVVEERLSKVSGAFLAGEEVVDVDVLHRWT